MSTAATENGVLGQSGVTPYDLGASHLRQYVRQLPLSRTQREARRIQGWSLGLAVLLHCGVAISMLALPPEPPAPKVVHTGKALAPVQVIVLLEEPTPEKKVEKEEAPVLETVAELEPAPALEELPDMEPLEAMPVPKTKQVTKKKVRKKMVARKAPTVAKAEPAPAAPVATTKAITAKASDAPGEAATTAKAEQAGTNAGGDPTNGSTTGTAAKNQAGASNGSANEGEMIDLDGLRRAYMRQVSKRVHRKYRYPRAAERARMTGRVLIEITIDASGNIVSSRVKKSSGHARLDKAALKSIASLGRLPAPPSELKWKAKRMTIPFDYKLRG